MPWHPNLIALSQPLEMQAFYVCIVNARTGAVRNSFEAFASNKFRAISQFIDLCEEGEVVEVLTLAEHQQEQRYLAADRARDLNRIEWSEQRAFEKQVDANRRNPNPLFQQVYS